MGGCDHGSYLKEQAEELRKLMATFLFSDPRIQRYCELGEAGGN